MTTCIQWQLRPPTETRSCTEQVVLELGGTRGYQIRAASHLEQSPLGTHSSPSKASEPVPPRPRQNSVFLSDRTRLAQPRAISHVGAHGFSA